MRKYLLAAASALAFASPAAALDNAWYVGVEGGAMVVEDTALDYETATASIDEGIIVDHKMGIDLDLIGGYDFGSIRAEAELGYKRAAVDEAFVTGVIASPGVANHYDS